MKVRALLKEDLGRILGAQQGESCAASVVTCLRELHKHPGFGAVMVYRFGQWTHWECPPWARIFLLPLYFLFYNLVRFVLQIELPYQAKIDGGLRIFHYGGIIVHRNFVAGRNLTLGSGVIIGEHRGKVPRVGHDVFVNPRVLIFGDSELGDNVVVGAGSVVTKSFASNSIIAGVPAHVLRSEPATRPEGSESKK